MFGDDEFVPGGGGVGAMGGLAITPIWFGEHGLGAGVDFGYLYQGEQTSRGGAGLRRFPLLVSLQGLIHLAKHWHLRLAAGPQWEFAIKRWIGEGDLYDEFSQKLGDELGFTGELGVLFVTGHLGLDVALRYTHIRYHFPSALPPLNVSDDIARSGADGSCWGLVFSVHYLR